MTSRTGLRLDRRQFMAFTAASAGAFGAGVGASHANLPGLRVLSRTLDVKGKAAKVFGILGPDGKPGATLTYGDGFNYALSNETAEQTLIHWHGQLPPLAMDGTPVLSGNTLQPGETRAIQYANLETGTHWMHSHFGLQEQQLMAAPLIVREKGDPLVDEQEHVIIIHDFSFRDPNDILKELQGGGGGHNMDHSKMDHSNMKQGSMQHGQPMTHLSDITYDAMLANDRTLDDPEIVRAEKAGRFRLRIINASASTNLWIELGEIEGQLIAVDGKGVKPLPGRRFPLAMAQRADIRLTLPHGSGAWPVLFQSEGSPLRAGVILQAGGGTIAKIGDQGESGDALTLDMEAQLQSIISVRPDPVNRVEMVMLTGGDENYSWGLNGKPSMHDVLFNVREGERYEVMFHNMTSMSHPMHLHGHYFQVVDINGKRFSGAVRDTVLVPVGAAVTIQFDATNPGTWPLHCHHLYHMNSGMMGTIAYAGAA
jgi:FtsP/CotA-like multicopper oxidase with cupredoxin domain